MWCPRRLLLCFALLLLRETSAGIVRRPPAFAQPVYADAYLPAAMQVIFHSVEQLKLLQSQEAAQNSTTTATISSSSSTVSLDNDDVDDDDEKNSQTTPSTFSSSTNRPDEDTAMTASSAPETNAKEVTEPTEKSDETGVKDEIYTREPPSTSTARIDHEELPESHEETPEANYATPESNYETPEVVQQTQETNHELPERNEEEESSSATESGVSASGEASTSDKEKKKPTVDSIVEEIYEIVKPTSTEYYEESEDNDESKKSNFDVNAEKMEKFEEEQDENRFTLLGEKVSQVPRPSLSSYLKRAKVPPRASLQQLATLYDALSKDARKQGFGRYSGYSDEVLKTLEVSAEGGVGPQLRKLLEKVVERSELTRDDAKSKTNATIRDLDDPSSCLSKDLRRLLPLRYVS